MAYTDKAVQALRKGQFTSFETVEPPVMIGNGLTWPNSTPHLLDLSAFVPPGCYCILIRGSRQSGSGNITAYPNSTAAYTVDFDNQSQKCMSVIPIVNQELKYHLSVANDVYDVEMWGYWYRGRIIT